METIKAVNIENKLNEIRETINNLSLFAKCCGDFLTHEEYINYIGSEDFQNNRSVIDHKKLELIKLITQL